MINRKLLHDIPRRITASGNAIILPEQTADLAFIIERGTAKNTRTGNRHQPRGDSPSLPRDHSRACRRH